MITKFLKNIKAKAFSIEAVCMVILIGYMVYLFHPLILFKNFPIPLDALVGLYHPWRDLYSSEFPSGIPFKNFLITDSVRQLILWRELAVNLLKTGHDPIWNPYNFAGYGLSGNIQTAAYYPLNAIFLFVPFIWGWSIQVFLQPILGAVFMFFFLRRVLGQTVAALFGSLCWVGSGFFTAWMTHNTLVHAAIWVPLALYASEEINSKKHLRGFLLWVIAIVSLVLAGAPQISLYALIFITAYHSFMSVKKTAGLLSLITPGIGFLVAGIFAWPQIVASINFLSEASRSVPYSAWREEGWFLPWQNLIQFFAPDFFGNPATLNYFGIWNYMEFVGFIGVTSLILAGHGLLARSTSHKAFFIISTGIALLFMLPNIISQVPYQLGLPLLSLGQPTRLMFIIDFSLAFLAAYGLKACFEVSSRYRLQNLWLGSVILIAVLITLYTYLLQKNPVSEKNIILPVLTAIAIVFLLFIKDKFHRQAVFITLLFLVAALELLRFNTKFISFSPEKYFFPTTEAITFLRHGTGATHARVVSLNDELMPANTLSHFQIYTLDGYDSLMPKDFVTLVDAFETGVVRSNPTGMTNRILRIRNPNSELLNLFGVKYVATLNNLEGKNYRLVKEEGKTKIYENLTALPRSFFVGEVRYFKNYLDELNFLISKDFTPQTVATTNDDPSLSSTKFSLGKAVIEKYSPTEVTIRTSNDGDGFLILSDNFSEMWRVTVDGKAAKLYRVDYTLRGILLKKGEHIVNMSI